MPIHKTKYSFLALGDSYTIGESVPDTDRFPMQTEEILFTNKIETYPPRIIAITGWTTSDLLKGIEANSLNHDFDIVTLLIGVNNQYQGKSIKNYETEFFELLNIAIGCAAQRPSHVFVLSIPDYSVMPFAVGRDAEKISQEIHCFNLANNKISKAAGVHYINITPISKRAARDPSLIANDGLHPSGKQYALWSQLLAPEIVKVLK
ncbi:MAG: SGNH/GDSL hydrolase family protein [Bacteroidetes bacterium]|nr:SGNH/GDSL hydrolase family protein [Bacteroidota bacterium]